MESFNNWKTRFLDWVQHEPVRAAEAVRMLLFSLAGALAFVNGLEDVATQISGVIAAGFSIYASQRARGKVQPVITIPDEHTEEMERTDNV